MRGAKRSADPICSGCYSGLLPVVDHLRSLSARGHAFHEPCIQHLFASCWKEEISYCPVSKANVRRVKSHSVANTCHCGETLEELRQGVKQLKGSVARMYSARKSAAKWSRRYRQRETMRRLHDTVMRLQSKVMRLEHMQKDRADVTKKTSQEQEDVWSNPNWPKCLEKKLVDLLIEEMRNIGMMRNQWDVIPYWFNDEDWDRVCNEFNARTGKNYDKTEMKKHLAVLHKRYSIVKPLYDETGHGWDHRRKMIDIDDGVWAEILEVTPEVQPYRKYGCPIYDQLEQIFPKPLTRKEYMGSAADSSFDEDSVLPSRTNVNISNRRNKRQFAEPVSSVPKKKINQGPDNLKTGATATASGPNIAIAADKNNPCSVASCLTIVNGMQGVDRRMYNDALDLLQNPSWRKTFVSLKAEKRLTWLKAMLPGV